MGPDAPTDPADWSIDEVVDFLCGTLTPWSQSTNAPRPDVAVLEAALRDNQVTGGVLLNHVDLQVLRDDLGLKPFGPRSNIMTAIEYLRRRSGKYRFAKSYIASSGEGDCKSAREDFTADQLALTRLSGKQIHHLPIHALAPARGTRAADPHS